MHRNRIAPSKTPTTTPPPWICKDHQRPQALSPHAPPPSASTPTRCNYQLTQMHFFPRQSDKTARRDIPSGIKPRIPICQTVTKHNSKQSWKVTAVQGNRLNSIHKGANPEPAGLPIQSKLPSSVTNPSAGTTTSKSIRRKANQSSTKQRPTW